MLEAQLARLRRLFDCPALHGDHLHLTQLRRELSDYFAGKRKSFDVPLHAPGSDFEHRVWRELQRIPCGETRSYVELGRAIGAPKAARAVGRANGMNRLALVIPCHRVIRDDGTVGGYGGGRWRKEWLLRLERQESVARQSALISPPTTSTATARKSRDRAATPAASARSTIRTTT
ncbi:MAG: methylated-DNA--[protein]-cysteine S-methyltransferase [Planctomycetes bacterium]|nr:methylated-DNA--[protein]-cysteine S-methyltransferase [Planctomycetota bacterium]